MFSKVSLHSCKINRSIGLIGTGRIEIEKCSPYKMQILQEPGEDDPHRLIYFCKTSNEKLEKNSYLLKNMCFNDECTLNYYLDNDNPRGVR